VTETIHRLVDPGDLVVDIGANIGYFTSLAAVRAGRRGSVVAVEPHPKVFELLRANVKTWQRNPELARVDLHRLALSNHTGVGKIVVGPLFELNMGLARLAEETALGQRSYDVLVRRLDELVGQAPIGLLKVDVEGHEAEVFRGARTLLQHGLVRDIIFEDHEPYPSEATSVVEGAGYYLVALDNDLRGVRLQAPRERGPAPGWPGPSYLATTDPSRSVTRLSTRGWQVSGIGMSFPRIRRRTPEPGT
jgi:FkbM family methyltransferase